MSSLLTTSHAAEVLSVSERHVRNLIAAGELKACRFGRSVRIHPDDLAAYINAARA